MFDVTTWLKTWTGALLACLLVLAVAAPSSRAGLAAGADWLSGDGVAAADWLSGGGGAADD